MRSSTSRFVATFRAEQESDCLLEQFAWVSLAFPVSPGLAASAAGTCRFGGVDAAERLSQPQPKASPAGVVRSAKVQTAQPFHFVAGCKDKSIIQPQPRQGQKRSASKVKEKEYIIILFLFFLCPVLSLRCHPLSPSVTVVAVPLAPSLRFRASLLSRCHPLPPIPGYLLLFVGYCSGRCTAPTGDNVTKLAPPRLRYGSCSLPPQ